MGMSMSTQNIKFVTILILILAVISCQSQDKTKGKVRKPAVAGQFYSGQPTELQVQLQEFFNNAKPKKPGLTRAVISPHAGYVFSGQVAASAINQVDPNRAIETVFILGSAHRVWVDKASVYNGKSYQTPLGEATIDTEVVRQLLKNNHFRFNEKAHLKEHSLEVQLPILQYHLKKNFRIVPILINTKNNTEIEAIAQALSPFYNEKNLFVLSTDFSHYPENKAACKTDSLTAEAVASGNPEMLLRQIKANENAKVPQLKTSMCGLSAMLVMLNLVEANDQVVEKIEYRNSSDSRYGEKNRVVGYWAMRIIDKKATGKASDDTSFSLDQEEKAFLLNLARKTINQYLKNKTVPQLPKEKLTPNLRFKTGCFVTLHKNGRLRGCIGNFSGQLPLAEGIQEMAVAAATEDPRFNKVKPAEMESIDIEISVLTPLKRIETLEEFELGKHGIYIKKGMRSGTYLPQVAEGRNWSKEEFVSHCSQYKAKIGPDGWKKADLFTYKALIFSENHLQHE